MKNIIHRYIKTYTSLNKACRTYLLLFLVRSYSAGIVFYIAIYFSRLNLNTHIIGFQISSLVLGNLLGSLLASYTLNLKNALKHTGWSLFAQGLCFLLISFHPTIYLLALSVFFLGFFGYFYQISSSLLITSLAGHTQENRSQAITLLSVFSNLGLALGGVSVSILSKNHAHILFLSTGVLLILAAIPHIKNHAKRIIISQFNTPLEELSNFHLLVLSLVTIMVAGIIFAQQRIGFSIFLNDHFSGVGMSSVIILNSSLIIFLLPFLRPILINRFSKTTMGLGVLLLGGGMFALQYVENFYLVSLLCVIWTVGEMITSTLSHLICFQSSKKEIRGRALSIHKFLYAFGTLLGALIGTTILKSFPLNSIWDLCGLLGVLLFIATIIPYPHNTNLTRSKTNTPPKKITI